MRTRFRSSNRQVSRQPNVERVVEYPFYVANYNNLAWFHQHFHGKEVLAGFARYETPPGVEVILEDEDAPLGVIAGLNADMILSRVRRPEAIRFRNLVDVTDSEALRRAGADYVLFHKIPACLPDPGRRVRHDSDDLQRGSRQIEAWKALGRVPVFEDGWLAVFRVPRR